jgi:hypothetical protein
MDEVRRRKAKYKLDNFEHRKRIRAEEHVEEMEEDEFNLMEHKQFWPAKPVGFAKSNLKVPERMWF